MRGHDVHDRDDYKEEGVRGMMMIMMMTELQNIKCFTQIKSFKLNSIPGKVSKLR